MSDPAISEVEGVYKTMRSDPEDVLLNRLAACESTLEVVFLLCDVLKEQGLADFGTAARMKVVDYVAPNRPTVRPERA